MDCPKCGVSLEVIKRDDRLAISHIPCFEGVGTVDEYEAVFRDAGFNILRKEISTKEIIKTALYLCSEFKVKPTEISQLFATIMNAGEGMGERGKCFFQENRLGFCLIVAEK